MAISETPLRVLAQSKAPVHMSAGDVEVLLERDPMGPPGEAGPTDPAGLPDGRWLLLLEGVLGQRDATVLHLSWRQPRSGDGAAPAQPHLPLGSAALYGLRRASLTPAEPGLTLCVDVTAQRASWLAWWAQPGLPLELAIRAQPGLTASSALSIQCVRLVVSA